MADRSLATSWYSWDPFIYQESIDGVERWTGLDVKLVDAIFADAGISYTSRGVQTWPELMEDLAEGCLDMAIGGVRTREREEFSYFSDPYRRDYITLYVPRGQLSRYEFRDIDHLFRLLRERSFRLGVVSGWSYTPVIDRHLAELRNRSLLVFTEQEEELVPLLLERQIDAYLSDRISGQTRLWRLDLQSKIQEHPKILSTSHAHVMFSRKTASPELVERFDKSLQAIQDSGEYDRIVRGYLFPILLAITVETSWFFMIDIIGTIAFSLSGIFLGRAGDPPSESKGDFRSGDRRPSRHLPDPDSCHSFRHQDCVFLNSTYQTKDQLLESSLGGTASMP